MTARPFAVVTGASGGIGRELASQFAANGFDLLITAEGENLETVAAELRQGERRLRASGPTSHLPRVWIRFGLRWREPGVPLMRGPTETDFFHRAGLDDTKVGATEKDDPAEVAQQGFKALMDGKAHIVSASFKSKMMGMVKELLPESVKAEQHRKLAEPGSA